MSKFGPLVSPEWLHKHGSEPDLRVLDFRWYLVGRQGRDAYLAGHIPGAVFVDLDAVTGKGPGRHPLPTRQQFQEEMQRAGISASSRVVVYDDAGGSIAARLWFLLGWFGHGQQAVLDSGLQGWGQPLETAVGNAIAARRSRSIPRKATSPVRSAPHGSTTWMPRPGSSRPKTCGAGTKVWASTGRMARSCTADRA